MKLALGFANWIRASEMFELAAPQILPIVAFRLKGSDPAKIAAAHADIVDQVTRDGHAGSPTPSLMEKVRCA